MNHKLINLLTNQRALFQIPWHYTSSTPLHSPKQRVSPWVLDSLLKIRTSLRRIRVLTTFPCSWSSRSGGVRCEDDHVFAVSVFGVFPARCISVILLFLLLYHYNFIFIRPRSYPREVQTIVTRCFIVNLEPVHWCDADCTDA